MKSQCAPLRCPWDHCSFSPTAHWALHWKPECFLSVFGIHCVLPGYSGRGEILAPLITMQLFLKEALIHVNDASCTKHWWTSSCPKGSVWNCYECCTLAADWHTALHLAYRLVKYEPSAMCSVLFFWSVYGAYCHVSSLYAEFSSAPEQAKHISL